jgi:hypothetical protein
MLSPTHEPGVRESGSECDLKRGSSPEEDELSWLGPLSSPASVAYLTTITHSRFKNRLVDFIVADSVGSGSEIWRGISVSLAGLRVRQHSTGGG